MQLADPSVLEPSSTGEAAVKAVTATDAPEAVHEGVNGGGEIIGMDSNSVEEKGSSRGDEGDKMNSGGNRWPRQETLALLKIRSDMDAVFRDSSLKGPLWDEVSRYLICYLIISLTLKLFSRSRMRSLTSVSIFQIYSFYVFDSFESL